MNGLEAQRRLAMKEVISLTTKRVCGLDLGDKTSAVCVCGRAGEIEWEGRVRTTVAGLAKRFKGVEPMRIALETGTHSPWVSRQLRQWGHEVIVANASKVRLIGNSRRKNDRLDARTLADLASVRPRLLSPIEHLTAEAQAHRGVLRSREVLVRSRSSLILHARGSVKAWGGRLASCSAESFVKRAQGGVPAELLAALSPILETIGELTARIKSYDRQIEELLRSHYPQAQRLRQVRGVGPITALAFVLAVGDPQRFGKSRTVGAYFGLTPAQRDSGSLRPQLRISKQGDPYVRKLLVQCAHYILGPHGVDSDLRRVGERLAQVGGKNGKKRAVVAVARKLAVLLHRLLVSGQPYEPLRSVNLEQRPAA
jgi:transposase